VGLSEGRYTSARGDTPARGDAWYRVALCLWVLSFFTGFFVLASGFNSDPDDYSSAHYAAQVPRLLGVTIVSVLVPLAAAAAAVLALRATPPRRDQVSPSAVVLFLALTGAGICLKFGIDAILQAAEFAEHSPM